MSVKDIFNRRCAIIVCAHCGKVKRHGRWVELTTAESQKLSQRYHGFDIIYEDCTICQQDYVIGIT